MHRLSPIILMFAVAVLGLIGLVSEGWLLYRARQESVRAWQTVARLKQEGNWLARQTPSLRVEHEVNLTAEVAAARLRLAEFKQTLAGAHAGVPVVPPPAGSTEAFFALAEFIRQLRADARVAQVVIRRDESFGFASYTHAGPPAEQVAIVHRQRLATEYLVRQLLASRPQALLAVRRERPGLTPGSDRLDRVEDFFATAFPRSVEPSDELAGEAYQLEFTGQTAVLRFFLNGLATGQPLVVVRSLQVEPLGGAGAPSPGAALAPLVGPLLSKFTVTVEVLRLADNPGKLAL